MKKSVILYACVCTSVLFAGERIIYKSNFNDNKSIVGWYGTDRLKAGNASVVKKNGDTYVQVKKGFWGVTCPLSKPVPVNNTLKSISLKLVIRQDPKGHMDVKEIALTSRKSPAGDHGGPFFMKQDSGISVRGYQYNNQAANFIYWRSEGTDYRKTRSSAPYNLFPKTVHTQWTPVSLVYDHAAKTFTYTCGQEKPLVMHNVDLTGTELNAVFIGNFLEVKEIQVTCVTK